MSLFKALHAALRDQDGTRGNLFDVKHLSLAYCLGPSPQIDGATRQTIHREGWMDDDMKAREMGWELERRIVT